MIYMISRRTVYIDFSYFFHINPRRGGVQLFCSALRLLKTMSFSAFICLIIRAPKFLNSFWIISGPFHTSFIIDILILFIVFFIIFFKFFGIFLFVFCIIRKLSFLIYGLTLIAYLTEIAISIISSSILIVVIV